MTAEEIVDRIFSGIDDSLYDEELAISLIEDYGKQSQEASPLETLVNWHKADGMFWIRLFGMGFSIVNKEKHRPLFSERHGYRNALRIGKWGIEWLPKRRL